MSWNEGEVLKALNEKRYINGVGIIDRLPPLEDVMSWMQSLGSVEIGLLGLF